MHRRWPNLLADATAKLPWRHRSMLRCPSRTLVVLLISSLLLLAASFGLLRRLLLAALLISSLLLLRLVLRLGPRLRRWCRETCPVPRTSSPELCSSQVGKWPCKWACDRPQHAKTSPRADGRSCHTARAATAVVQPSSLARQGTSRSPPGTFIRGTYPRHVLPKFLELQASVASGRACSTVPPCSGVRS